MGSRAERHKSETESKGIEERESEHWLEIGLVWVKNGHY